MAQGYIAGACCIPKERVNADGRINNAFSIVEERAVADSYVSAADGIAKESLIAHSRIAHEDVGVASSGVAKKSKCSYSRVVDPGAVAQKCCSTDCRISVCGIGEKRSRPNSRVEAAVCGAKERTPPNCGVTNTGREAREGILPFRRVETRIPAVWWRDNRYRCLQKREGGDQTNENQSEGVRFHTRESASFALHTATRK